MYVSQSKRAPDTAGRACTVALTYPAIALSWLLEISGNGRLEATKPWGRSGVDLHSFMASPLIGVDKQEKGPVEGSSARWKSC
jgi:hypothetical protein